MNHERLLHYALKNPSLSYPAGACHAQTAPCWRHNPTRHSCVSFFVSTVQVCSKENVIYKPRLSALNQNILRFALQNEGLHGSNNNPTLLGTKKKYILLCLLSTLHLSLTILVGFPCASKKLFSMHLEA